MSVDAVAASKNSAAADPLRLLFCPNCDYSREGIADGAPCPECGMRCDSSVIVLQDDVGDETEPGWRKWRRWIGWTMLGLVCLFVLFKVLPGGRITGLLALWPMVALLGISAFARLTAWRRAHAQMWLHEQGFELTTSTEESRRAVRLTELANAAYAPVMALIIMAIARDRGVVWAMAIIMTVYVIGAAGTAYLMRRANPRINAHVGDFKRTLIPWRSVVQLEVLKPVPGRVRVRCRCRIRLLGPLDHSQPWLQIDSPCDDARYDALHDRLYTWRTRALSPARAS